MPEPTHAEMERGVREWCESVIYRMENALLDIQEEPPEVTVACAAILKVLDDVELKIHSCGCLRRFAKLVHSEVCDK